MAKLTHAQECKSDSVFIKACELAGTPVTKRQHSKFMLKKGKAFSKKDEAVTANEPEKTPAV